ncbi:sigma-70 family RNA polymerase sigma factor [Kocuria sp. SL71]|uniref:sigma-70 family RNA polymerase sigma factor n=1 Tax=Kocuria sp. SL71 TaxID=2995151 RepID=UPI00227384BD|nr:sigma-70 family RNA polymerase sigma factor [Kocuria sp. SL71]MCY1684318.1 sigma-70 family RNA polymerase sigma factor [Kocuria sp. SL71]
MNPHHENPADSEPEATSHGPASGHEPRPQDGAEAGPGTQTPRSAADDAGAAAAPIAPADLESPQEESAAPEDEAIADEALLDSARAGDESSYAALYERHRSTALNVARMHTRNVHDAEDLVSEAFARILSVLRRGGGPRKYMRSYLVTTIGRLAVDHGMAAGRVRPSEDEAELDRPEEFDDVVVRQCEAAVVATAYGSLPERWQAVLWHTEIEGMKPAAVAEELQISPNAVSALAKRARQGLQSAYLQAQVSAEATDACPEYAGELGAFAAGTLASRRRAKLQQHLDACPRCTAEYLQLEDVGVGLRVWILRCWRRCRCGAPSPRCSPRSSPPARAVRSPQGPAGAPPGICGGIGRFRPGPADPSALTPAPADGAVAAGSETATGSAGAGSAGGAGSASEGGKLGMGADVAGGIGLKVAVGVVAAAAAVSSSGWVSTLVRHDDGGASAIGGLPFPAGEGEVDSSDEQSGDGEGDGDGRGGDDGADSGGSLFGDAAGDAGADSAPGGGTSSADPADASDSADRLAAFGPADQADDQSADNGADSGSEASAEDSRAGNGRTPVPPATPLPAVLTTEPIGPRAAAAPAAVPPAATAGRRAAQGAKAPRRLEQRRGLRQRQLQRRARFERHDRSGSATRSHRRARTGAGVHPRAHPRADPGAHPRADPGAHRVGGRGDLFGNRRLDRFHRSGHGHGWGVCGLRRVGHGWGSAGSGESDAGDASAGSDQSDTDGTTPGSGSTDPSQSGMDGTTPGSGSTDPSEAPADSDKSTAAPTESGDEVTSSATDDSIDPTDPATEPGEESADPDQPNTGGTTPGSGSTDPNQPPAEVEGATWVWVPREQWPRLWQTLWPWGSGYWEMSADTAE